jgi:hypothetical protein
VYAGAAREAVFSVPAVVRRVNADFVPLALRAPLVNNAQGMNDADEKWLYQRVSRAKLAPQGICVLNSAGQVLAWVQMFDDDQSVLDFLDHGLKRFQEKADARAPVITERYMRYPSQKLADFQDERKLPSSIADKHPKGKHCLSQAGKGQVEPGALVAKLVGRALDSQGKPVNDVVKQEHYVEDQFGVSPELQRALTKALADTGTERVRFPEEFSKLCASHAHLGHIDVRPCLCMIKDRAENKGEWKRCVFWARRAAAARDATLWRVEGQSEVVSEVAINATGMHNVKLAWEGFVVVKGNRLTRLVLSARGTEKLQFAKDDHPLKQAKGDEVAFLPAGRPIDVDCGVRYGILSEPAAAPGAEAPAGAAEAIPDEARKPLVEALGGPFLVYRDKVQDELKLSDEQKQKLMATFPDHVQETMKVFEKIKDLKPQERGQAMQEHRRKSEAKLSTFLKDNLDGKQQERLLQLQLQQAGVFALLGQNEAFLKLKITDEQRGKFGDVVQEMEKKIHAQIKEVIDAGGNPENPEELRAKVMKIRNEHAGKIEAILSSEQKKQWKELLGKPFDLVD